MRPPGSPGTSRTAAPRMRTATSCRSAGPSRSTRGSRSRRGPRGSRAVTSPRWSSRARGPTTSTGDRTAIETLTGRPYAEVEGDLAAWAAQDDAPVTRTGQAWRIVSKEDAWDLVSALITKTTLNRFHDVAARVLEEHDPALDVPAERRFMATVVGEPRTYSPRLRAGIADTVAFLGGIRRATSGSTTGRPASSMPSAWSVRSPSTPTPIPPGGPGSRSPMFSRCSPRRRRTPSSTPSRSASAGTRPCCARSSSTPSWGRRSAPRRRTSVWSGRWRPSPGRPRT